MPNSYLNMKYQACKSFVAVFFLLYYDNSLFLLIEECFFGAKPHVEWLEWNICFIVPEKHLTECYYYYYIDETMKLI